MNTNNFQIIFPSIKSQLPEATPFAEQISSALPDTIELREMSVDLSDPEKIKSKYKMLLETKKDMLIQDLFHHLEYVLDWNPIDFTWDNFTPMDNNLWLMEFTFEG